MSFREGLYFSITNYTSDSEQQNTLFSDAPRIDFSEISSKKLVDFWNETFEKGIHRKCFSIYEDGHKPGDIITAEQVNRRIQILKPYTIWVRSFSCIEGNEHIPRIAHQNGMKTLVGAWLGNDLELNEKELESLIQLAKEGCVNIAAVGNELIYRVDLTDEQLLDYIHRVKESLPNVPVVYVDAYYEFSNGPNITEACDVILTNCYPYWEGCPIEYSLPHM